MNNQSAENYLDELLNSVNHNNQPQEENTSGESVSLQQQKLVEDEASVQAMTQEVHKEAEIPTEYRKLPKSEAEFLMEFEKELATGDYEDFLKEFEESDLMEEDMPMIEDVSVAGGMSTEEDMLPTEATSADDMFAENMSSSEENLAEYGTDSFGTGSEDDSLLAFFNQSEESVTASEGADSEFGFESLYDSGDDEPLVSEVSLDDPSLLDITEMNDEDLISLLAETDDLADIGDLLSQGDKVTQAESEDAFASFAESEMAAQETTEEGAQKASKPGFFDKLKTLLFGKDEEETPKTAEEPVDIFESHSPDAEELSDENAKILASFAEADKENASDSDNKKAKKEKKKKEPKAKKEPKPKKPPKPKKEKKPKPVDNTPPLPKGPVALVCLLAASIFALVFLGPDIIGYSMTMSKAEDLCELGHYAEAAEELNGVEIKKEDEAFYTIITYLSSVDSEWNSYQIFINRQEAAAALDSLINAAGRIDNNVKNYELGEFDEKLSKRFTDAMDSMKKEVEVTLQANYDMSFADALKLYKLTERDRDEYTYALNQILMEKGMLEE